MGRTKDLEIVNLNNVFVLTGFPEYTYVIRNNIDHNVKSCIGDRGTHIFLFGSSKNGKTSLWKKYINSEENIEIKITKDTTLDSFINIIVDKLQVYTLVEKMEKKVTSEEIKGSIEGNAIIIKSNVDGTMGSENETSNIYQKMGKQEIDVNKLIECLKPANKIIIIEDFHIASDNFIKSFSHILKALADEKLQMVIVGIDNKVPLVINEREDIKARIKVFNISNFEDENIRDIIELGCNKLNISFSDKMINMIVKESEHKAYIAQAICKNICIIKNIERTLAIKQFFDELNTVEKACKLLAHSEDEVYKNVIHSIASNGTASNKNDTYIWTLKVLEKYKISDRGITNREFYAHIRNLGNSVMKQGSINACIPKLPSILNKADTNIQVFSYRDKRLFITDDFFQFYLRWSDEMKNYCDF